MGIWKDGILGVSTGDAISSYWKDPFFNGISGVRARDYKSGAVMRMMKTSLYLCAMLRAEKMDEEEAVRAMHRIAALAHRDLCEGMACGLYFYMVRATLNAPGPLSDRLQEGIDQGFAHYGKRPDTAAGLEHFLPIQNLADFQSVRISEIKEKYSFILAMESAVRILIITTSFKRALLKASNPGSDTARIAAMTGGLAGLYYGADAIPEDWLSVVPKREWTVKLCDETENMLAAVYELDGLQ